MCCFFKLYLAFHNGINLLMVKNMSSKETSKSKFVSTDTFNVGCITSIRLISIQMCRHNFMGKILVFLNYKLQGYDLRKSTGEKKKSCIMNAVCKWHIRKGSCYFLVDLYTTRKVVQREISHGETRIGMRQGDLRANAQHFISNMIIFLDQL